MAENLMLAISVGKNVTENVLVLVLLMAIGFFLSKKKILSPESVKQLTEVVLTVVIPCVIINAYQRDFDPSMARNLCRAFLLALVVHAVCIALAPLIFKKREDKKDRIRKLSFIYSNCSFIAIPLVQSLYGSDGVFYAVAYITVFNIFVWTHGIYLYTRDVKQLSLKKAFTTPGFLGTVAGVAMFFLKIRLPSPVVKTLSFVADLNTPVPMIILGTYLTGLNLKETVKDLSVWAVSFLRLIAAPIIGIFAAKMMNLPENAAMSIVLSCACPVATISALFAVRYGLDREYASEIVSVSTLLGILTIPAVMFFATIFF